MKEQFNGKLKAIILALMLFVLCCSDIFEKYIPILSFYDEIVAILFGIYFIHQVIIKRIKKNAIWIILLVLLLCLIGFIGNIRSELHISLIIEIFDAFNIFKFVLVILGGTIYFENQQDRRYLIIKYLSIFLKVTVLVSSAFMFINIIADIGMHTDYRYGIRTYNFIFSRVGELYSACVIWLIIFTTEKYLYHKKNNIYIILTLVNMCATLRSRAIAFACLYIILIIIYFVLKPRKFKIWYFIPVGGFFYLIAADQFEYYFSGDRARNVLLRYGLVTAKSYFPIGSGFGTYGTAIAQKYYSPLYDQYDFSSYYGLSRSYDAFLTDNYWPAVMGEFGFVGVVLMVILLLLLMRYLIKYTRNKASKICVIFAFVTLFISSLASSSFFACTTLMVFVCLVCCMTPDDALNKNR